MLKFKNVILVSAFLIASCAAFFSVVGFSQLLAGAAVSAMVLAGSLELGKLVLISFVYRYWTKTHSVLRVGILFGAIALMLITSSGVYGYLNSAYAKSAIEFKNQMAQTEILNSQQNGINSLLKENNKRVDVLNSTRNQQENRSDQLVGKTGFITQQRVIQDASKEISSLQLQNIKLIKSRDSLELLKIQKTAEANTNGKIGSFNYIAQTLNVSLDTVAKWFIFIVVFVTDPLSITLIVAYNLVVLDERKQISSTIDSAISTTIPVDEPLQDISDIIVKSPEPIPDVSPPISGTEEHQTYHQLPNIHAQRVVDK